jgi:hypothetical protein
MALRVAAAWLLAVAPLAAACSANEPVYFPAGAPLEVGAPDQAAAGSVVFTLPFRPPSAEELMALRQESERRMVETPWLRAEDLAVSLLYTITNLGEETASARLEIDGASEFAAYDTQALRAAAAMLPEGEETDVLALIRPTPVLVEPGQTVSGTVREDDFDEAALDLDAIGRFAAVPAAVIVNRSEVDPVGLEMVPPNHVRPAFFRVQVMFSAGTHMRVELILRVRDDARRLMREEGTLFAPDPPAYAPMVPAP